VKLSLAGVGANQHSVGAGEVRLQALLGQGVESQEVRRKGRLWWGRRGPSSTNAQWLSQARVVFAAGHSCASPKRRLGLASQPRGGGLRGAARAVWEQGGRRAALAAQARTRQQRRQAGKGSPCGSGRSEREGRGTASRRRPCTVQQSARGGPRSPVRPRDKGLVARQQRGRRHHFSQMPAQAAG
jgi:hypothetical protein